MNFAELGHSILTGRWKLDRLATQERMKLFAGGRITRDRPTPSQLNTPEDYRQATERIVMIRAARQMEEDMPFFDGILSDFETYVVGELRYMPATGNPEADKLINAYLEWQFDQCDFSERLDLVKAARLCVRSAKRDGEVGTVYVDRGDEIKLSFVSGDRIGNPTTGTSSDPKNFMGIVVDEPSGAPVLYEIYKRASKMNLYTFQMAVKANDFIHYYDPYRFEQYHGVPCFKNGIEHALDMKQIMDFTKLNIKWRSAQLPYVTNEQGKPRGNGYDLAPAAPDGEPRPFDVQVGGVTQSFLKLGEGVMEYPNDFPNQQFQAVMNELKRDCAVGCKLPLEFCYRSESGGVVQRFYVNKAEQTFLEEKRWLKKKLLNPYKNRVIQKGIDTGFLNLSRFGKLATDIARFSGTWQMGRSVSVDYGHETDADIKQVEAGLMSQEDFCAENGRDLKVIRQQKKQFAIGVFEDAAEIALKTGVSIDIIIPYVAKIFPNPAPGDGALTKNDDAATVDPSLGGAGPVGTDATPPAAGKKKPKKAAPAAV